MIKKSKGNMYDWVSHMHSHLGGECPHKCSYCYVKRNRFGVSPRYEGEIRLIEKEFAVNYGIGKTIFIEHMNDMFAEGIRINFIEHILEHCRKWKDNSFVFQTKNPDRAFNYIELFPQKYMIGTTIESNRSYPKITKAPSPRNRFLGISKFLLYNIETFITIEPILDFDIDEFATEIISAKPTFINIGADSKECNLPEPPPDKVKKLITILQNYSIVIKKKNNLGRLM